MSKSRAKKPSVTPKKSKSRPAKSSSISPVSPLKRFYIVLSIIATLGGVITFAFWIYGLTKTQHDKFIEANYITGIFAPFSAYGTLQVSTGGAKFSERIPPNGVFEDIEPLFGISDTNDINELKKEMSYRLKIKYHRFLLSIVIRDFKTDEIIAEINDNKWITKISGIKDYNSNNLLEIIDKYGYVAFSMWVDDNNVLQMRGYIVGHLATYFMNGNISNMVLKSDPQYLKKCSEFASQLKPRFNKNI